MEAARHFRQGGKQVQAVIFDYGRTLYDNDAGALFPETVRVVETLSATYTLAIVSLLTRDDYLAGVAERHAVLRAHDLERHFAVILFTQTDKDRLYQVALDSLGLTAAQVAVVDDRVVRGIRWGNRHGAMTIWLRNGKFSDELPDHETGLPMHTIRHLSEVIPVLQRTADHSVYG